LQLKLLVIVLENGGNGFVHAGAKLEFPAGFADSYCEPPIAVALVARARGIESRTVATPEALKRAVTDWLRAPRPFVLELRVDRNELPPIEGRVAGLLGRG
jgi:thiamine pyrophosphate-dependent acetolactate synthase large subunit-like protein